MIKWIPMALLAAAVGAVATAHSAEPQRRGGFLLNLDLDYGGDDLVSSSFQGGESKTIKAGSGAAFGAGGWFRPMRDRPFELQATAGAKYVSRDTERAHINVFRLVFQLNGVFRFANDWYVGGGLVHHYGPQLNGDGYFASIDFDDATGISAELGWKWIGLHVATIEYSADDHEDAAAGYVGLRLTWRPGS
jgi:hypothetical protein